MDLIRKTAPLLFAWLACGWLALAGEFASGQELIKWKTGPEFRRQLDELEGIAWENRSLRDGLSRISQKYSIAIFLDRRIDPGQEITVTIRDQPLESLLKVVASQSGAGLSVVGPVVYMGPAETAAQLATFAALRRQDVSKLPNDVKARLLRSQPLQWDDLAQPRQLVDGLATQAKVQVENGATIPLDLWPAVSLPPLPWTDRMTLLLAGFGLTFQIDEAATSIRLVPQPTSALIEKHYAPRGSASDLAAQLRRVMPDAAVRVEQGQLVIAAKQEDHDKIDRLLSGQSVRTTRPAKTAGEKVYSLHAGEQPAGAVVRKIATDLGKELKYEPAILNKLKQPVKLDLDNVTLDYLLEATLKPLGLTYRLTPDSLEIVERE